MLIASVRLYLALTLAIGAWSSRLVNSASDFTLAGRHLPASVVGVVLGSLLSRPAGSSPTVGPVGTVAVD